MYEEKIIFFYIYKKYLKIFLILNERKNVNKSKNYLYLKNINWEKYL